MTLRCAISRLAAALLVAGAAFAQVPPAAPASAVPPARPASASASASGHAAPASHAHKSPAARRVAPGPTWRELSAGQHQALAPLAAQWDTLNEAQKRKWIALSGNYPRMSGEEQAKLHSRMTEWVALSPQERTIARLNYGRANKLSPADKKAKWEAYQALSPEEKKKLAATSAAPKPPTTAAALRPVPREKLAHIPQRARHSPQAKAPRIAAAPNQVDRNTLLPQPQPQPQPPQPQPQLKPPETPAMQAPPAAVPAPQAESHAPLPTPGGTPD